MLAARFGSFTLHLVSFPHLLSRCLPASPPNFAVFSSSTFATILPWPSSRYVPSAPQLSFTVLSTLLSCQPCLFLLLPVLFGIFKWCGRTSISRSCTVIGSRGDVWVNTRGRTPTGVLSLRRVRWYPVFSWGTGEYGSNMGTITTAHRVSIVCWPAAPFAVLPTLPPSTANAVFSS